MTRLLTIKEASSALSISRSTLFVYLTAGRIQSVKLGRHRRIPESEIDRIAVEGLPPTGRSAPVIAAQPRSR